MTASSGESAGRFYDGLAGDYELVYGGEWERAVDQQAAALDRVIRKYLPHGRSVLDCACGIGTQAIGLAGRGYRVVGTDLSHGAIDRARHEARRLGIGATFDVADFRDLSDIDGEFDVVISCDNALPHLLEPADVLTVMQQMRDKLTPAGLLVVTIRDFDRALREWPPIAPPLIIAGPQRRILVRLHDWDEDRPSYTLRLIVLTECDDGWHVTEHTTRFRAITRTELTRVATDAGFSAVHWLTESPVVGNQQVMTARR
jgi:SAM-dependent methyltransferase